MAGRGNRRTRQGGTGVKIVVTGPFAAGKTTLIRTISEISVLSTEKGVTDETRSRKAETTVAMDFGRITIDTDLVLYLFGTPGQERFDFMWDVLGEGMLGYVLLVDGERRESLDEARGILTAFRRMSAVPFVVGVNRTVGLDPEGEAEVRHALDLDPSTPVVPCDVTDRESVKAVLLALLHTVVELLDVPAPAPGPVTGSVEGPPSGSSLDASPDPTLGCSPDPTLGCSLGSVPDSSLGSVSGTLTART